MTAPQPAAPLAVRRMLTAPRFLVFCRLCPLPPRPRSSELRTWPGALVGHEKRPAAAADIGRRHLEAKHADQWSRPVGPPVGGPV